MSNGSKIIQGSACVEKKIWGPGDTYLSIQIDQQVFEGDGFKEGDKVNFIIIKALNITTKGGDTDEG